MQTVLAYQELPIGALGLRVYDSRLKVYWFLFYAHIPKPPTLRTRSLKPAAGTQDFRLPLATPYCRIPRGHTAIQHFKRFSIKRGGGSNQGSAPSLSLQDVMGTPVERASLRIMTIGKAANEAEFMARKGSPFQLKFRNLPNYLEKGLWPQVQGIQQTICCSQAF